MCYWEEDVEIERDLYVEVLEINRMLINYYRNNERMIEFNKKIKSANAYDVLRYHERLIMNRYASNFRIREEDFYVGDNVDIDERIFINVLYDNMVKLSNMYSKRRYLCEQRKLKFKKEIRSCMHLKNVMMLFEEEAKNVERKLSDADKLFFDFEHELMFPIVYLHGRIEDECSMKE
jgi:hypothetical protein